MKLVVDTNVILAAVLNESTRQAVVRATQGATLFAPAVLPFEIGNALSAMIKRQQLTRNQAMDAERAVAAIPVKLVDISIRDALELAIDQSIYAYDAYFLRCAADLALPLLTLDRQMNSIATRLGLTTLTIAE